MNFLVTGTAGFIGFHLVKQLLRRGDTVVGLDNINQYYDLDLKHGRLMESGIDPDAITPHQYVQSQTNPHYRFMQLDLIDGAVLARVFSENEFDAVVHLAAQAGVRYSLVNPATYMDSNLIGFFNILENSRLHAIHHLVYASSSSVYGLNTKMPFSVHDPTNHPISLYAATKKANELMAHSYSHLYQLPTTGLRFFTVYGPWGRPDMAYFLFTKAIFENRTINVYNHGDMKRDFTYIDDIVAGTIAVLDHPPQGHPNWSSETPDPALSSAPYRIYNIGNNDSVRLLDFIEVIEKTIGREAHKNMLPLQPGDVPNLHADMDDLITDFDYHSNTPIEIGIQKFVDWFRAYYSL